MSESFDSGGLIRDKATICVVNYRTADYTRLCLRSIRRFTDYPAEVIVVDNDSRDESTDYLRSLDWITLLSRSCRQDRGGSEAHARALDLGFSQCQTEFFVVLHSDTFVHHANWLSELIGYFDEGTACVGSGKLDMRPHWQQVLRNATDWRRWLRRLRKVPNPRARYRYYNRTICCVYRTAVLRREGLAFSKNIELGMNPGKQLYFDLVERGYHTVELPPAVMGQYVWHIAHATEAVVIDDMKRREHTLRKSRWRIAEIMSQGVVREIMQDSTLDAADLGRARGGEALLRDGA